MATRSFPFADQEAGEDDYYLLHRESGVLSGLNLTMTGLGWSLSPGEMYVAGSMLLVEDTPATGTSGINTGANPRRDLLVARRTLTPAGSSTVLAVKVGPPATSPADPAPTQQRLDVWEEPLFSWRVPGGSGGTATDVRDRRNRYATMVQKGKEAASLSLTNNRSGTVTFNVPFSAPPQVQLTVEVAAGSNVDLIAVLTNLPTATGFTWRVRERSGSAVTVGAAVHWRAEL